MFTNFFRLSTFIGLFSHFENQIVKLNDSIQERKKYKIKPSDLIGDNVIEKNYRYLKLVVGIELDDLNAIWKKLRDLQKIRNRFVHNNSSIIIDSSKKIEEQKLYSVIKKYPLAGDGGPGSVLRRTPASRCQLEESYGPSQSLS